MGWIYKPDYLELPYIQYILTHIRRQTLKLYRYYYSTVINTGIAYPILVPIISLNGINRSLSVTCELNCTPSMCKFTHPPCMNFRTSNNFTHLPHSYRVRGFKPRAQRYLTIIITASAALNHKSTNPCLQVHL